MHGMNMTKEESKILFAGLDIDRNGIISYTEFIAAMLETQGRIDEERITEAFEVLDSDHSGEITRSNIQGILAQEGNHMSKSKIDNIFLELETERGCAVSKEEFLDLFRKKKMA
mmetsp:Transcript_2510/g.3356  ORF Transcript_2510/g.3356 Transcript_2510/m.3356 type:complete len:114 (-) Transcript_2510:258-599(-)